MAEQTTFIDNFVNELFSRGVWFRIAIIVFLIWFTWNLYQIRTQKYVYNIEFAEDSEVFSLLEKYGNMGCIVDSARRATSGEDISTIEAGYEFVFRCPK